MSIRDRLLVLGIGLGIATVPTTPPVGAASLPSWAAEVASTAVLEAQADEEALVLLDDWTIRLKGGKRSGRHRTVTRVLKEQGIRHATFTVARGSFDRFAGLRVWVAEGRGKTTTYGEDEGILYTAAERKVLDETEVVVVSPPGVGPGTTVAVEYDWESSPEILQDVFKVQREIPVVQARIALALGEGWRALVRTSSDRSTAPEEVADTKSWVFRDVPGRPVPEQDGAPAPRRTQLAIDYAPAGGSFGFRDWRSTAGWVERLFDVGAKGPLVARAVGAVRDGEGDAVDRVGSFVRRMRYFSVSIGWGGYRPRAPEVTLARGFGDCKDKSILMVAMLRDLGIPAVPILTTPSDVSRIDGDLSGPRQFNHCIVGIPWEGRERRPGVAIVDDPDRGPIRVFDPTMPADSAQDISTRLEGAQGLPVGLGSEGLIVFPHSGAGDNLDEERMVWALDRTGGVSIQGHRVLGGVRRAILEDEDGRVVAAEEFRRSQYSRLSDSFPGLFDLRIEGPATPAAGDWTYAVRFKHAGPLHEFDELRVVRPPELRSLGMFPLPDTDDEQVVYQPYLAVFRRVDEIVLDGQTVIQLPAALELANALGRVTVRADARPDRVVLEREVRALSLEIDPTKRAQVLELRSALRRANQVSVVLRPTDAPAPSP